MLYSVMTPHQAMVVLRQCVLLLLCLLAGQTVAHGQQQLPERRKVHARVTGTSSKLAAIGALDRTRRLNFALALPLRNEAELDALIARISDPASPEYRHYLTPAEFAGRFGPTQQDYDALAAYAESHGLRVTGRYANRLVLDVEGAVPAIEKALHINMRVYRHPAEARNFFAPDQDPALDLAVPVAGIEGLSDYDRHVTHYRPMPRPAPAPAVAVPGVRSMAARPHNGTAPDRSSYIGSDFRHAYAPGVALTGSGQVVGLVQFDGYTAGDITYYENLAGLPNVPLTNVLLDNFSGAPTGTGGEVEVSLDIEMVVSMAPGVSQIVLYEAGPSGIWYDVLNRIASDNLAKSISCSWGDTSSYIDPTLDGFFKQMASQGQTFYNATGDSDAFTGAIPFPSDDPYIVQVGGTTLTDGANGGAWVSETVWNWGRQGSSYVGSSGGISKQYGIPAWQAPYSMTTAKGSTSNRNTPDVALTGDGVYVRVNGADQYEGGTSCAAPLWAGFTALVNQQAVANGMSTVGFINPAIYALGLSATYNSVFHDIATGNNAWPSSSGKFYAVAGYDLCTGLGTPAGAPLINALASPVEGLVVSSPTFSGTGGVGGAFSPSSVKYTIWNYGASTLIWTGSASAAWLSLARTSGSISISGSSTFAVSINANANSLASGTYSATLTFTDAGTGFNAKRLVSLAVVSKPVITSTLAASGLASQAFSYQITASNNPASYSATGLPAGLAVGASTGIISGTPASVATTGVTIGAANAGGTGTATLVITIGSGQPVISSPLAASGTVGYPFAYQIVASNSPASYTATPLPTGLAFDAGTGLISGTAAASGTTSVIIQAINNAGSDTRTLQLVMAPHLPVITSSLAVTGSYGVPFTYHITALYSPTSYGATGLPPGMFVSASNGIISGSTTATGTTSVTLSAINTAGTGTAILALAILPPPAPVITSATTATGYRGMFFTYRIVAAGNPANYSASGLPVGLDLNSATGLISGTASGSGSSLITIGATNLGGTGTAQLLYTVLVAPPVITSTAPAIAVAGRPFSYQITAANSPTGYGAAGLPAGLSVDPAAGLISGTATASGTSFATISASNVGGSGSAGLIIIVQTPYAAWQSHVFNNVSSSQQGDLATPAGDGIPNLMKYALGLDPLAAGSLGLPALGTTSNDRGSFLTLTYTHIFADTDIIYTVEVSGDMATWISGASATSVLGTVPSQDGLSEAVTVQDLTPLTPGAPSRFIRLRITRP